MFILSHKICCACVKSRLQWFQSKDWKRSLISGLLDALELLIVLYFYYNVLWFLSLLILSLTCLYHTVNQNSFAPLQGNFAEPLLNFDLFSCDDILTKYFQCAAKLILVLLLLFWDLNFVANDVADLMFFIS